MPFDMIARATEQEPALLPKSADQLRQQFDLGLSAMRFSGGRPIAHATLWHLAEGWYELGTVWVAREYRGHDLSAELYRDLFRDHPERNILATTTNPASLRIGIHVGLRCVPFSALPAVVWRETCCCPAEKTGTADNVASCVLRQKRCFVRVTEETWQRLGRPAEMDFRANL